MENTLGNKAKFFAKYLNQHIVRWHKRNSHTPAYLHFSLLDEKNINKEYLELKHFSSITDEEATELGKLRFGPNSEITSIKILDNGSLEYTFRVPKFETVHTQWIMEKSLRSNEADFLRSKGFAVPFNGLSVEELVNRGWVKFN